MSNQREIQSSFLSSYSLGNVIYRNNIALMEHWVFYNSLYTDISDFELRTCSNLTSWLSISRQSLDCISHYLQQFQLKLFFQEEVKIPWKQSLHSTLQNNFRCKSDNLRIKQSWDNKEKMGRYKTVNYRNKRNIFNLKISTSSQSLYKDDIMTY